MGVTIIAFQKPIWLSFDLGVVFVLIAAIANAIYFILQKPLLMKYRPLEVISYSTWIATLMLLPFGRGVIGVVSTANMSITTAVIYIAIATVVAHICWSKILSKGKV